MADPKMDDPNHNLSTIPLGRDEVAVPARINTGDPSSSSSPADPSSPRRDSSASSPLQDDDEDERLAGISDEAERTRRKLNLKLANPLGNFSVEKVGDMGEQYCREFTLGEAEDVRAFRLGAMVAKDPNMYREVEGLTEDELQVFSDELEHKWRQPKKLYLVILLCSLCAAVQGMDETVVNGAQIFYKQHFGIGEKDPRSTWLVGLLNSGPYLCCAVIGCWLTIPFNNWFGRRGTIFLTCFFSATACFWQAFANTWWHMFVARFFLGFGIGPKSATVPIYAAETAPPPIRGALIMCWQMFTAFGIFVGYAADLMFYEVNDPAGVTGMNWRLMMASAMVPAVVVCCFVFMCPESPRWYISQNRHHQAWTAIQQLRFNKVQAARDLFYIQFLVRAELETSKMGNKAKELITVPRNRRALQASELVMFMQQFCGVNIIAYYSSEIFIEANLSELSALGASMGFGAINFFFALPAFYTIDTFGRRNLLLTTFPLMALALFGRRNLLLTTFPLMALALFFTGFSFLIPETSTARIACIALGIYIFGMVYSPGEGPVPFTNNLVLQLHPLHHLALTSRFGRRNLLLTTFPLMALALFFTGFSFLIPETSTARIACIALGIYIFGMVYSPGEGPVPFTYSAEAYPLYIRSQGMSLATATTWFFNFILSITWPSLLEAFGPTGAFCWYAAWNVIGFFGVLVLVPETKGKTLEELDVVFGVKSRSFALYGLKQFMYFLKGGKLNKMIERPEEPVGEPDYDEKTFQKETERVPDRIS
ncbi:hypothetical protein V498_02004 [Pseudogymnoascus sp. VKM F-4517 (FW-2822)]|nr:hypothetical protein V498_02004 [Pseudogymnoascus sp. VKM F-4517 (FW-2822)]